MNVMRRPWYTYLLLFIGLIALLGALFRPTVGATSTAPGGRLLGKERRLEVQEGSPLDRAGIENGDRFVQGEFIEAGESHPDGTTWLRWTRGIPRSGNVEVVRSG